MLTGKYYTGFLSVCQIPCWTPGIPRVSGVKRGILPHFWGVRAKFIFMVPVTFLGFWGGYPALVGMRSGRALPTKNFDRARKRGAGSQKLVPRPSPMKSAPANFLEFFEEEPLVDLAGVAGLTQVVLFEGARTTGGVSAPASNRLQIITTRGQGVGLAHAA